jgi:hypothetical protein
MQGSWPPPRSQSPTELARATKALPRRPWPRLRLHRPALPDSQCWVMELLPVGCQAAATAARCSSGSLLHTSKHHRGQTSFLRGQPGARCTFTAEPRDVKRAAAVPELWPDGNVAATTRPRARCDRLTWGGSHRRVAAHASPEISPCFSAILCPLGRLSSLWRLTLLAGQKTAWGWRALLWAAAMGARAAIRQISEDAPCTVRLCSR